MEGTKTAAASEAQGPGTSRPNARQQLDRPEPCNPVSRVLAPPQDTEHIFDVRCFQEFEAAILQRTGCCVGSIQSQAGARALTLRSLLNLKGMNVEALMKLRNQVDERLLFVAIGLGVGIALAIIGYLLHWISS
jgi:hypothetical protein